MADEAVYVEFSGNGLGTLVVSTRGYHGPVIARLQWERKLSREEQVEINNAIRLGAAHG